MEHIINDKQYLTEKEVAHLLNISLHKLQKDRRLGVGLKFVRIGRAIRYANSDITEFLSQNSYTSTSQYGHGGQND